LIGPFLKPGDPITVVAPSGVVDRRRLAAGIAYLRRRGHPVITAPHVKARDGYFAGRDAARAADLNAAFADDRAGAIFLARGGYGLTRILDCLDLEKIRRRPRPLLGFSDATALFMALQRRGPYLVHYGPLVSEMGDPRAFDEESLWSALYGRPEAFTIRFRSSDVLRQGTGKGRVIGGCLSLLVSLLGTPHDPDYRGAILFWEEIAEEPYRIDRMLAQLRNAGKFDQIQGMVVGSLTGCHAPAGRPSLDVRRILSDLTARARFPIVWNLRAGHIPGKITLPLGIEATLSSRKRSLSYRRAGE
jgi:muramoyltetrapeptide carboxypeptidase